jgi:hypothetical protein
MFINSFPTAPLNLGRIRPMRSKNCSFPKLRGIVADLSLFGHIGKKSFLERQNICIKLSIHQTQHFIGRETPKRAYLGNIDTHPRNMFFIFIFAPKKAVSRTTLIILVNAYPLSYRLSYFYVPKPSAS